MTEIKRPPRPIFGSAAMIATGLMAIAVLFVLYAYLLSDSGNVTPDAIDSLYRISYAFYVLLFAALGAVAIGMYRYHKTMAQTQKRGLVAVIAYHTWNRRSRAIFVATFVVYGIFFSLTSGTLVYQPEVVFSYHYGAQIPSIEIIPCCDEPGYMPKVLAYITEHVGLQVIPINLVLQITVSYLVALNVSIAMRALEISRAQRSIAGIGAVTGLFIACPTCVGTVASIFVGAASGITLSVTLAHLQTSLIAISIPILVITPFLLARRMSGRGASCN